jgi:hypothetical protein
MKRAKVTFVLLLIAGTLLLLPGLAALILGAAGIAGAVPGMTASQALLAIGAGLVTGAMGALPLCAFFLRAREKGRLLAKVSAGLFLFLCLPFPFALAVQGPAPWLMLGLAALALWILTVGFESSTPA